MIYLTAALTQSLTPATLPGAVRTALGKPLRRAAPLTQLAVVGALACLPPDRRHLPTALLWQTTGGPRAETQLLLEEVCQGPAEPMPYDFLATQPAIAAAQLKPFLPGLRAATSCPLDSPGVANWSMLLCLASNWLEEGRFAQVLCAHLEHGATAVEGHWLALSASPLENSLTSLQLTSQAAPAALPDTADFPLRLAQWVAAPDTPVLQLCAAVGQIQAVEFAQPQPSREHHVPIRL